MSTSDVLQYKYLWDGSWPGWVLTRINGNYVDLTLKFEITGPSTRELLAVRRAVSEFKSQPLHQVVARLRASSTYPLGRFESKEARSIAARCRKEGLNVVEEIDNAPRFLPTNELTNSVLLIEDDGLAKRVCDTALLHGIPVRQIEF